MTKNSIGHEMGCQCDICEGPITVATPPTPTANPVLLDALGMRLAELKRTADKAWERHSALSKRLNDLRRERDANRRIAWEMTRLYEAACVSHTEKLTCSAPSGGAVERTP